MYFGFLLSFIVGTFGREPLHLGGCIGKGEMFPKDWIPLLQNPCDYLCGPLCNQCKNKVKENIGIVGAGMAGLTMAWILTSIGHNVELTESTDRLGGRVYTYYSSDVGQDGEPYWYGDLGAMRFPPKSHMPLMHTMFDLFKIPLKTFTNTNEGESSYYIVNGKYINSKDYEMDDQAELEYIYNTFGIQTDGPNGTFPKYPNGKLRNPSRTKLWKGFVQSGNNAHSDLCQNDMSMKQFYEQLLRKFRVPLQLITVWTVMEQIKEVLPYSANQYLNNSPEKYQLQLSAPGEKYVEVVGGTSVLPERIYEKLTSKGVDVSFNKPVSKVIINNNKVKLHLDNRWEKTYDKVVITPTSRVVSLMDFSPPLTYRKKIALNSFRSMNSVKVFLAFKTPFWEKNNKIPAIPYNTTGVNGGSGVTDLSNRVVYYPSHPYHGPSLLASYVWGEDADRLTSLSDEELKEEILDDLVEIHGEVARIEYKEGKVIKWLTEDWAAGGFPWAYPGQMQDLGAALQESHMEKVFFAGEYTSKFDHGWIQAAVESACRVSYDMFGNGQFGQEKGK